MCNNFHRRSQSINAGMKKTILRPKIGPPKNPSSSQPINGGLQKQFWVRKSDPKKIHRRHNP